MSTCWTVTTMPAAENGVMPAGSGMQRRDEQRDRAGEHEAQARRHEQRAEGRRHHEAGADAHERPEQLAEPCFELSCGEGDHGLS